jgi:hypothetical protein
MTTPVTDSTNPPRLSFLRTWIPAFAVSLTAALMIVSPFFWLGTASGHDIQFHASSWVDAAGQWKEGIAFPRWTEWANHGFGEPRFLFYPPTSWVLGAALGFVVPWNFVPMVFIVLVQTMAGVFTFAVVRRLLPERAAFFGAVLYAANPDALLIIYVRSDFAELLAMAFFPLLFLLALQVSGIAKNQCHQPNRTIAFFSVVFAAVWLSNAPAGVMASYTVALLFAWAAATEKSWRLLLHGAAGLALGFGLMAFYLLPAAYEQRWVNIGQVLSSGLLPAQNFLYARISDPEHNEFNWIASSVAVLLMVMTATASIAAYREAAERDRKKLWRALLVISAAASLMMIRVTSIFWEVLPKLRFVQFPWRWMSILAVPCVFFLAAACGRKKLGWLWSGVAVVLLAGTGTYLVKHTWWDTEDIPSLRAAIAQDQGFDGTDEYDPLGDDHYNLPEKAARVKVLSAERAEGATPNALIRVERWTAEEKELRVTSRGPLRLALRLLNYPAWRVEVNGTEITPERGENFSQMILPLRAGESHIVVRFTRTRDRTLGIIVSCVSLLPALLMVCWPRERGGKV